MTNKEFKVRFLQLTGMTYENFLSKVKPLIKQYEKESKQNRLREIKRKYNK